jgi:hypothetical protein
MSVKIKINWDNENVVSESVRIYRADSAFTSTSLPPLLTEIVGDVYEYEDLTTVEDQTYFYMLSAKLGDLEVFTECFEVFASGTFEINFPKITQGLSNSNPVLNIQQSRGIQTSKDGKHGSVYGIFGKMIKVYQSTTDFDFNNSSVLLGEWIDETKGNVVLSVSYFGDGSDVIIVHNVPWSVSHYKLNVAFRPDLGMTLQSTVSVLNGINSGSCFITPDGSKLFRYGHNGYLVERYNLAQKGSVQTAVLFQSVDIETKLLNKFSAEAKTFSGFCISSNGQTALVTCFLTNTASSPAVYKGGRLISLELSTAFDLSTAFQSGFYAPDDTLPWACHPICVHEMPVSVPTMYAVYAARQSAGFHIKRYSYY